MPLLPPHAAPPSLPALALSPRTFPLLLLLLPHRADTPLLLPPSLRLALLPSEVSEVDPSEEAERTPLPRSEEDLMLDQLESEPDLTPEPPVLTLPLSPSPLPEDTSRLPLPSLEESSSSSTSRLPSPVRDLTYRTCTYRTPFAILSHRTQI